ncbi:hypothetical protein Tco_0449625 [Tanacetum coccineum]
MAQIIQCLGGKTGGHDQISNKDAIILYCLANGVKVDYAKLIWEDIIHKLNKKNREKVVPYPRFISLLLEYMMPEYDNEELTIHPTQVFSVLNWALKPIQPKRPPFTDHIKAIYNIDVHGMDEETKNYSFDHIFAVSNRSVLVDKTKSAGDGLRTAHTDSGANEKSRADNISLKVNIEDLSDILKDTRSSFFTPDSPPDEPIIVSDEIPPPPSPKSAQIQELMAQIKELKKHVRDMKIELPGDLKEIPTKLETFTSTISSLSSQVTDTLNRFSTMVENASRATSMNVPSAGKATASPVEGEKNTKDAEKKENP